MKLTRTVSIVALGLVALLPARASAGPITASYGLGTLSGSVSFDVSGSNLVVTLTNTSTTDPTTANEILTGIFFDVAGDPTLAAVSADICSPGCSITNGGALGILPDPLSVAGEWGYKHKTNVAYGANYGLSATRGVGKFLDSDLIGGGNSNQSGEAGPAGVDYGVTTANDLQTNDKSSLWAQPLISNQVIFTLSGLPAGFDLSAVDAISHVQFQYGTSTREAPEPAAVLLLTVGAAGAMIARRRKGIQS